MKLGRLMLVFILLTPVLQLSAQGEEPSDSLRSNLILLKRYLDRGSNWYFTDPTAEKQLSGLISFIENEPVDSLVKYMKLRANDAGYRFVSRIPENTPDSLLIPGYIPYSGIAARLSLIRAQAEREFTGRPITVPGELLQNMERDVRFIPEGQGMLLFTEGIYRLPDSLKILDAIPDHMVQSPEDFRRILRLEEARKQLAEQKRIQYNDSVAEAYRNRIAREYRQQLISQQAQFIQQRYIDSVRINNFQVLRSHNEIASAAVNDSVRSAVRWITEYARLIDNTSVNLVNLTDQSSPLILSNAGNFFTRVWLKNRQNDSLSVLVQNIDNRSMRLVIEDGYIFSRFRQQAVKDFDFTTLNRPSVNLDKVNSRFQGVTPWTIGGDGNVGFTQTYLNNWKKGGKSAMSILLVGRGYANYFVDKLKWENSAEVRNGWIKPGDEMIQKNDDKFRLTSRLGLSAFQKWYYSSEVDFETQFFNGYKYPDTERPISSFLAPGRFLAKIGLDYKPHKDFSLFISPLTSKTVFIIDTVKIDQTNYGIARGKTSHWEPGISTDVRYKKEFPGNITYETRYRMFVNYLEPIDRFEIDWENIFNMQLNEYISLRAMLHTIYDTKVLFDKLDKDGKPVLDQNGQKIREPKLQLREFITIGFSYKINRRVLRVKEVR